MKKVVIAVFLSLAIVIPLLAQSAADELITQAREAIKNFDIPTADNAYKEAMKAMDDEAGYKRIETEWKVLEKINILLADARHSMDRAEYAEALKKYSAAIAAMDASPQPIWDKVKGEAHYSMGMVYFRQDKPTQAADEFRSAVKFNAGESKYGKAVVMVRNKYYSEGHKFYKRKDYTSAKEQYEIAVAVDPSFASGYYMLALIAKKDGDLNQAEKYYQNAVTSDPTHYKAWYGLGTLYSEMGNNKKAIESLKMSISINANYEKAYYVLAKVYESQKNTSLATKNLKRAIEVKKDYTKAYELLGKIYVDQEQYQATVTLLKKLKGKAISYKINYRLAQAYNGLGNYSAALTFASKAASSPRKRNWAPALIEKGIALKGLKRNKEAIAAWRMAAKDARWKSVAKHMINELMNK